VADEKCSASVHIVCRTMRGVNGFYASSSACESRSGWVGDSAFASASALGLASGLWNLAIGLLRAAGLTRVSATRRSQHSHAQALNLLRDPPQN